MLELLRGQPLAFARRLKLLFGLLAAGLEHLAACFAELNFRSADACLGFILQRHLLGFPLDCRNLARDVIHLLMGFLQKQLVLLLLTAAQAKQRIEGKVEGHGVVSARSS